MGEVELTRDKRIGRDVARKRMHPDLASAAGTVAVLRFLREATVQGRLEHPSIVPVYDLERTSEGTFFTMKRIRGDTLADVLARGLVRDEVRPSASTTPPDKGPRKWSLRAVLGAFVQVARAVHFAHTRGVVHRDLKPANVMLGEFGEVYVLDWGLAKNLADAPATTAAADRLTHPPLDPYAASSAGAASPSREREAAAATEAGSFLGTLGYAAPEQIVDAAGVDARADVYALGAILFEILAAEPAHPRIHAAQLLASTLAPVEVSARLGDRAPPELVELVGHALAVDRGERPADAGAVAEAVQRYLDGDRDLALRRAMAKDHRKRASALAESATRSGFTEGDPLGARRRALAELGRALALDAGDPESMRLLVSLLESPPAHVPDEVKTALGSRASDRRAALASRGAVSWLAALAMVPAMGLMGVRSWPAVLALAAVAALGALHAMRAARQEAQEIPPSAMLSGTVFVAAFSAIFGPLWLGTMAALACLVPWLTVGAASQRGRAIGFAAAGVLAPLGLSAVGVLPSQYAIREGSLVVTPLLLDFAPTATFVFLGLTCLLVFLIVAQFATSFRDEVDRSETSLRLLAWQLRQLAPSAGEAP
ncbi:MAG: serine/threonine protein kinase [Sandaracinaceae bacterium]|nr:serine/threonine protein kinase [Sandaracinaceae bacterium]